MERRRGQTRWPHFGANIFTFAEVTPSSEVIHERKKVLRARVRHLTRLINRGGNLKRTKAIGKSQRKWNIFTR